MGIFWREAAAASHAQVGGVERMLGDDRGVVRGAGAAVQVVGRIRCNLGGMLDRARIVWLATGAWGWLGVTRVATACPDCAPVRAARAAIQEDPAVWTYVLGTTLPFVIIGLVVVVAHRSGHVPRKRIIS